MNLTGSLILLPFLAGPAHGEYEGKHRCDDVAAHDSDPQKLGRGLSDNDVDPVLAIKHCLEAVLKSPEIARFHFQLGRAYWLSQQYKDAVNHFRQAAEMRYPAAAAYLGEAYEKGLGGLKKDRQKAKKHYERAIAGQFTPAEALLANLLKAQHDADQKSAASVPLEPVLTPRPAIWEHGIPDPPPQLDRILLTGETLALLALKNQPTLDIPALWEFLLTQQVKNDRAYYMRSSTWGRDGLEWGGRWDSKTSKGYHPIYVPFCPIDFFPDVVSNRGEPLPMEELSDAFRNLPGFIRTDQNAMALFKSWMLARAETLPNKMVLPGRFYMRELIFYEFGVIGSEKESPDDVFSQLGYPGTRIQRLREGYQIGIAAGLLLPNVKRIYEQHVAEVVSNKEKDVLVDFEVVVKKVEILKPGANEVIALIHLDLARISLISWIDYSVMREVSIK